jgi:phosphate transport system permease protein
MEHKRPTFREWLHGGDPGIWLTAGTVSFSLIMVFGLLLLIMVEGMGHFWPKSLVRFHMVDAATTDRFRLGEIIDRETVAAEQVRSLGIDVPLGQEFVSRTLLKTGNRDVDGFDFYWHLDSTVKIRDFPVEVFAAEREEWGNFYGVAIGIEQNGRELSLTDGPWFEIVTRLERKKSIKKRIKQVEKGEMGSVNYGLERLRLRSRKLELAGVPLSDDRYSEIKQEQAKLDKAYDSLSDELSRLYKQISRDVLIAETINGDVLKLPFSTLVNVFQPNKMSVLEKLNHYFMKMAEFILDEPREANTEGGVFPAIFGTVMMVMLMSVIVTPFGVIAAVYLHEYAYQGKVTRVIRIAVNNLAGVPSIVYGVFGLGFFVYIVGGSIDKLLFPALLPAPTFGTPGLLWSSLTLALLTVPVVIVATEEGLSRIPKNIREGSLALGATKAETLWRTVLPMATPAMITGLILAVARAAGEVAPLMMVGVVKLAPSLPLDGNFPFLHLDQKFMHLGFHIYDVGFQSPNVEAARPLVYATSLLLIVIIVVLNLTAIVVRNRLREKYDGVDT